MSTLKIDTVRLVGRQVITMPIRGISMDSRYLLKAYDGLNPPDIDIFLAENIYQGSEPQKRQPVFRIGLNPAYLQGETHADLRNELYGLLSPGAAGKVTLELLWEGQVVATASGWVKKFENVMFSKDPEVQITLQCDSAYLKTPNSISYFENHTLPVDNAFVVEYEGSAPTGFTAEFEVGPLTDIPNWFILYDETNENPLMTIGSLSHTWSIGDKIQIDTRKGTRDVRWIDGGVDNPAIHLLEASSSWPQLQPGTNVFRPYPFGFWYCNSMVFWPQHWGV